ncbi:hypothetical protein ACP70R_039511 [Stipagrostis hirtigluma subsp. patula]
MAGVQVQDLPLRPPRPILRADNPCRFLALLLGASAVVTSVAGEPSTVHAVFALAGFLLWLLGVARLLLFGQIGQHPMSPGALAANIARRAAPYHHLLMLLGGSVVVASVAGEPPIHAGHGAFVGFMLWLLGVAGLMFGLAGRGQHPLFRRALAAAAADFAVAKLKGLIFGRQDPEHAAPPA